MPKVEFDGKVYEITDRVMDELLLLAGESGRIGLEKGTDLCLTLGNIINGIGKTCTGNSCSIKIEDCGMRSSAGGFHTHPYKHIIPVHPSAPSWSDMYTILWENKYKGKPGLGCRVGIDPTGIKEMECEHVKEAPTGEWMEALSNVWDMDKGKEGWKKFPHADKYFYPSAFVEWPEKKRLKAEEEIKEPEELRFFRRRCAHIGEDIESLINATEERVEGWPQRSLEDKKADCRRWKEDTAYAGGRKNEIEDITKRILPAPTPGECLDAGIMAEIAITKSKLAYDQFCPVEQPVVPSKTIRECEEEYLATELKQKAKDAGISPTGLTKRQLCDKLIKAGTI